MKELKEILFEKAAKKAGMLDRKVPRLLHEFHALYSVIEEAGLEDEYYDWKRANGYMGI